MQWTSETLYSSGDEFFLAVEQAIENAQHSVDFETYIFEQDTLGVKILAQLVRAVARGVRVRLLLDGFGSMAWTPAHVESLRAKGVEVKIYHPLPWQVSGLRRVLRSFRKLNRRNHRKTCVVDGRVAFVGGMNVSGLHQASLVGPQAWRDQSARVEGPGVERICAAFSAAWKEKRQRRLRSLRGWRKRARQSPGLVLINHPRRERLRVRREIYRRLSRAQHRVWITNPYFMPRLRLLRALRRAARRGVDVRLLFPRRNDVWVIRVASVALYGALLRAGVRIFEYVPSVLHAKTLLIDEWSTVGSSNLNHRSWIHDLEIDVVLTHPASVQRMEQLFTQDLQVSLEVTHSQWRSRPLWARILEVAFYRFRYWY